MCGDHTHDRIGRRMCSMQSMRETDNYYRGKNILLSQRLTSEGRKTIKEHECFRGSTLILQVQFTAKKTA